MLTIHSYHPHHWGRTWIPVYEHCQDAWALSFKPRAARTTYACSHEWSFSIKCNRETASPNFLLWVRLWYEKKARRFVHLDASIVKPDPEFDQPQPGLQQLRLPICDGLLHNKTWRNTKLQLSKLFKIENSLILHLFQVISNHRIKKQRNFRKL